MSRWGGPEGHPPFPLACSQPAEDTWPCLHLTWFPFWCLTTRMTSHPNLQGPEGFPGCGDFCLKSRTGVKLVTRLTAWSPVLPGGFLQQR